MKDKPYIDISQTAGNQKQKENLESKWKDGASELLSQLIMAFDSGSGYDLRVMRSSPALGSALAMGFFFDSLFPLPLP